MKESPYWGQRLNVYLDVSDLELQYLYRKVAALIFSSRIEGFGLPLVEALQQGLPVIASDIPVFKEIGGEYPMYFRDGDLTDLARVLGSFPAAVTKSIGNFHWRSWNEAIAELIPLCVAMQKHGTAELKHES
jgi:alpha-1,2-rhamnosyltransferase